MCNAHILWYNYGVCSWWTVSLHALKVVLHWQAKKIEGRKKSIALQKATASKCFKNYLKIRCRNETTNLRIHQSIVMTQDNFHRQVPILNVKPGEWQQLNTSLQSVTNYKEHFSRIHGKIFLFELLLSAMTQNCSVLGAIRLKTCSTMTMKSTISWLQIQVGEKFPVR